LARSGTPVALLSTEGPASRQAKGVTQVLDNPKEEGGLAMPGIENKVVAHFRDGRIVKGYTYDFHPNKEIFHITGLKVKVTFFDKEVIYGSTHGYSPQRRGFFVYPANKEINNERVFVIRGSAVAVETWKWERPQQSRGNLRPNAPPGMRSSTVH